MGQVFLPDPRTQYNVLRVLLNVVQAPALSIRKPALFEQALEIIYELAASPETGERCRPAPVMPAVQLGLCSAACLSASDMHCALPGCWLV
jgi:hypothetical protein